MTKLQSPVMMEQDITPFRESMGMGRMARAMGQQGHINILLKRVIRLKRAVFTDTLSRKRKKGGNHW